MLKKAAIAMRHGYKKNLGLKGVFRENNWAENL
jgi:hypothetical protein